jgi:hypothetical protein
MLRFNQPWVSDDDIPVDIHNLKKKYDQTLKQILKIPSSINNMYFLITF